MALTIPMKGVAVNISRHAQRGAGLLAAIAVLIVAAGVAQAGTTRPSQMAAAEFRALMLRSQGLDKIYRLGTYNVTHMTRAERRALLLRSEGLNKKYGLGRWTAGAAAPKPAIRADGFSWSAFGIGAAAVAGLVLLLAAAIAAARRLNHRLPRVRVSS
jgi:hypothetical protein